LLLADQINTFGVRIIAVSFIIITRLGLKPCPARLGLMSPMFAWHSSLAAHPSKGDQQTVWSSTCASIALLYPVVPYGDVPTSFKCLWSYSCLLSSTRGDLAVPRTQTSTYGPHSCVVSTVGANKLELTISVVPWRNPDTQPIPTQTENVTVQLGLWARFDL